MNLLNNALLATQELTQRWVEVAVRDQNDQVEISVTDSGSGTALHAKIFQPFFTTRDVGSGIGLGLCIARSLIHDHNGEIFLATDCEHTRFVMVIPKQQARCTS